MILTKPPKDDPSRFQGDKKLCKHPSTPKKFSMSGYYELDGGYMAKYSLTKQTPSARYPVRGSVALLDPLDGNILKAKTRKKNAVLGTPKQQKEVRCAIDSTSEDDCILRQKIANAATRLLNDHILILTDSAEKAVAVSSMPFSLAVAIYADRYLNTKSKSPGVRHTRYLRLKKMASKLQNTPIEQLSQRTLKKACSEIGKAWREYVQESSSFLTFVYHSKRNCEVCNPFENYLNNHPTLHQRNVGKLQKSASNSDILSTAEEQTLNSELLAHPENGLYAGVSLIKDAHLSTKAACSLVWNDIIPIIPLDTCADTVLVRYQRDEITGATHCYDFPIVGIGAKILLQRKEYLLSQGYSPDAIAHMPVVSADMCPKEKLAPAALTAACRHMLRHAGVGYATLAGLREMETGGGVNLLLRTYEVKLKERCNLQDDPSLCEFLMHKSLVNSVQAAHYRSFTDASALHMMQVALRRDKRYEQEKRPKKPIKRKKIAGGEQITALAPSSHHRSQTTFRLRLKPGQFVQLRSQYGCTATVEAKKA